MHYLDLGGMSGIDTEDTDEENEDVIIGKFNGRFKLGVIGLTHTFQVNDAIYFKSSLAATGSGNEYSYAIPDDSDLFYDIEKGNINKSSFIASSSFNYKLNANHKLESGIILTRLNFNMKADEWDFDNDQMVNELSDNGNSSTWQLYASWKYRINDRNNDDQWFALSSICAQ